MIPDHTIMSDYESGGRRPSSSPGSSLPEDFHCSTIIQDDIAELIWSRKGSVPELPHLQKAQTWHVSQNCGMSESTVRCRKPSFRIALPYQQSSMLISKHVLPGGPTHAIQQPLLPTILSPFHLTPPAEELSGSPLEQQLSQYSASAPDPFFSDTASMSSTSATPGLASRFGDLQVNQIDECSNLDLSRITTSAVNELVNLKLPSAAMSMVHQPLPFPLPQRMLNNLPTKTLFHELLGALRSDNRLTTTGIRVIHALVDQLPAENLPTSPPVTPSYLSQYSNQQAQGYFTLKPIYPSIAGSQGLVLPPGEALMSITERMIPPSAEFEISSFLGEAMDSGFSERLSELQRGGLLALVLPTEDGGRTFHRRYLSPLLDPILRNISTRFNLRSQLSIDISNTVALDQLEPFDAMQTRIEDLLVKAKNLNLPDTMEPEFKLISSSKGIVNLPFEAWFHWWLGQEKSRISGLLNYHLNVLGQGLAGNNVSRSSILAEIQAEMQKTGAARGDVEAGIELGVFFIQRVN